MHSKPKLALAIITSPSAAFEEILKRKLLGTALLIALLAGVMSSAIGITSGITGGKLQYFLLGKQNPLTWMGLFFLYAIALRALLKWLGTEVNFRDLLTVMGWSQITLVLANIFFALLVIFGATNHPNPNLINALTALYGVFLIGYIGALAVGIKTLTRVPLPRAAMSYIVVELAALIGFTMTYSQSRTAPFVDALSSIKGLAGSIAQVDQTAWLAAAVVGLIAGLWHLGKSLEWEDGVIKRNAAVAGAMGFLLLGFYYGTWSNMNYYGKLMRVQRFYDNDQFSDAALQLEALKPMAKDIKISLYIDLANTYYQANDYTKSLDYFGQLAKEAKPLGNKSGENGTLAMAYSGQGSIYYAQGDYAQAIERFTKSTKVWREFRDPWVRLALAYDRVGMYEDAIKAGNHAVQKLESDAAVAWVALAEAFTQTGDAKQAKVAITMVTGNYPELAKKIGSKPEDWKNAVDKLSAADLKYPLTGEKSPAPAPEPKKPAPRKK